MRAIAHQIFDDRYRPEAAKTMLVVQDLLEKIKIADVI